MTLQTLLGRTLRDLPPLFTDEKPVSFDPVQMGLLQKLVRLPSLSATISVAKEDFFVAIVYLDTFAEILAARPTLLQDAGVIAEELERRHSYLDPDLELLVRYSLIHIARDLGGERFFRKAIAKQVHKRHEIANTPASTTARSAEPLDLFEEALGRMAADLFATEPVRSALLAGTAPLGRSDLRLAVVCDGLMRILQQRVASPDESSAEVGALDPMAEQTWPDRALALLQRAELREGGRSLADHIDALQKKLTEGAG